MKPINWVSEFNRLKNQCKGSTVFIEIDSGLGWGVWAAVEKDTPLGKVKDIAQPQYDFYLKNKESFAAKGAVAAGIA